MASKVDVAKTLLQLALGMGGGLGGRGPSLMSIASGASFTPGVPGGADAFMAKQYPTEFAPDRYHNYGVVSIPSETPNMNSFGKSYAGVIEDAGRMQTLKEHNDAIRKYVQPGMGPKELRAAIQRGIEDEKRLPQFWNESESRRPFKVSSSAVTGIRLTPDARVEVQWRGSPTWYTFQQYGDTYEASREAQKLLQADSIGRAVMPFQRHGKELKFKNKDVQYSWWNRPNYDAAFA